MEGKLPISRHFFKVMMPGFLKQLSVPKAFCRRLSGEKSKEAVLSSPKGLWNVKIAKSSNGIILFREGWDSFVHHHGLEMGDFLVFEHKGNLHFEVLVFEPSACERDFPLKLENDRKRAHSEVINCQENVKHMKRESSLLETSAADQSQRNPHFIATIKPSNAIPRFPYMHIPNEFVKTYGLGEIGNIILRDPSGKSWLVKLRKRRKSKFQRTSMGQGWYEFYVSNNLRNGDVCVFELDGAAGRSLNTAVMNVQIFPRPN